MEADSRLRARDRRQASRRPTIDDTKAITAMRDGDARGARASRPMASRSPGGGGCIAMQRGASPGTRSTMPGRWRTARSPSERGLQPYRQRPVGARRAVRRPGPARARPARTPRRPRTRRCGPCTRRRRRSRRSPRSAPKPLMNWSTRPHPDRDDRRHLRDEAEEEDRHAVAGEQHEVRAQHARDRARRAQASG